MTDIEIPWISLCDNNFSQSIIKSQHSLYLEGAMTWITPVIKFKSRARCFACSVGLDESISIANMSQTAIRIPQFVEGGKSFRYNFFLCIKLLLYKFNTFFTCYAAVTATEANYWRKVLCQSVGAIAGGCNANKKLWYWLKIRKHNIMYHIFSSKK